MEQIPNTPEQQGKAEKSLITGIIGLFLSSTGIPGTIVSVIALIFCSKAKRSGAKGGQLKTAKILSVVGLPVSVAYTVLYLIALIM